MCCVIAAGSIVSIKRAAPQIDKRFWWDQHSEWLLA